MEWWAVLTLVVVGPWIFYGVILLPLFFYLHFHGRVEGGKEGFMRDLPTKHMLVRFWHPHGLAHIHSQ